MIKNCPDNETDIATLREVEERWRLALEAAGDGVWDWNLQTGEAWYSLPYKAMLGFSGDEIGNSAEEWSSRVHPEDMPRVMSDFQSYLDGNQKLFATEFRMRCKNKEWKWIRGRGMMVSRDADGKPLRVLGTNTDISENKRAEAALQESEARFRSYVENANDVLFALTPSGVFSYVSPQWKEAFGYELSETIGRPFPPFVHPDDVPACMAFLQKIVITGSKQSGVEYRVLCKDGRYLWYKANASLVHDPVTGTPTLVGIGRDIDAIKRIEADLITAKQAAEAANLAKSRFLAAASHDLRQPIQAINLFSDALCRSRLDEDQKKICEHLSHSVRSLSELLNALLDVSILDSGALKADKENVQVEALFIKIDAELSRMAAEKSLRFKFSFPFRETAILTDGRLLMSLLKNLIGNAIKYTRQGGVLVAIRRRGKQALIQVWDTGIGIAPEHLSSIFDEYFQIGNTARDSAKGLGLGLAIANRLAGLLETKIYCRSRPGKGSVFEFYLPLADKMLDARSAQITPATSENTPASGLSGRRIVVVEDDSNVARAIKLSLESLGMSVTGYDSAEAALQDAQVANADFYISDYRLPGMSGLKFLDTIQRRVNTLVKAVILTGDTAPEHIERVQSSGWPVLFKPVDFHKLLSEIASHNQVRERIREISV